MNDLISKKEVIAIINKHIHIQECNMNSDYWKGTETIDGTMRSLFAKNRLEELRKEINGKP